MAKAWRLKAVKGSTPSARVQKNQQRHIDAVLNKGVKSNWLLAGLLIHCGVNQPL
jgi:hypothetical protein